MNGRGASAVRNEVPPPPAHGSNPAAASQAYSFPVTTAQAPYRNRSSYTSGGVDVGGSSLGEEPMPPSPSSPHTQSSSSNFKVVIRARPPLHRELNGERPFVNVVSVRPDQAQQITVSEDLSSALDEDGDFRATGGAPAHTFTFDYVYDQDSTQQSVYDNTARGVVDSSLAGYNATIFAYGQTGTGKTYTMEGYHAQANVEERGIIPRAIEQIFGFITKLASPRMRFLVRASYLQIYNEQISDLLKPERSNLAIREDKKRGVFVEGLSEWVVRSPAEIYGLMERGAIQRRVGSTNMNEKSSRSHAVFIIIAEQSHTTYVDNAGKEMTPEEFSRLMHVHGVNRQQLHSRLEPFLRQSFKVGKLNLVDLAGSERVRLSGATGQRLEESKKINQSLSALGNVIAALTDPKGRNHIPYRDSKLTRILEDSLGGNCRTTMMAMISPALEALQESLSTLKFANRAKNIKNEAKINEDFDQKSLLRKYERELKQLRAELEERSRNVVDKRRLLELDEQRRRAEADKMNAILALEARSQEFMREKEEKKKLEDKIQALTSQVIHDVNSGTTPGASSGAAGGGTSSGISSGGDGVLSEVSERLRHEYEERLQELEKERQGIEEEKAQVERYKQLLLKQRDIMIALTQRLNERDEQIVALQDELDGHDKTRVSLEEKLDEKTAELIHLQRVTLEQADASPVKNAQVVDALGGWGNTTNTSVGAGANGKSEGEGGSSSSGSVAASSEASSHLDHNNTNNEKIAAMAKEIEKLRADKALLEVSLRGNNVEASATAQGSHQSHALSALASSSSSSSEPAFLLDQLQAENRQLKSALALETQRQQASSSHDSGAALPSLKAELEATTLALRRAESARSKAEAAVSGARAAAEAAAKVETSRMAARCEVLVKERTAVQTIMELKVQVLVNEIARATQDVLKGDTLAVGTLGKELSALQRLVGASIQALRNAQAEDDLREQALVPLTTGDTTTSRRRS